MIVVAADAESFERIRGELPDHPVERVDTTGAVEDADALVVVVDAAMAGGAELVAELRAEPRLPPALVVAGGDPPGELLPADQVVDAIEPGAVAEATERALLAARYRRAVDRLYEACSERAARGTTDPLAESDDLRAARRTADEVLAAAAERPGLLSTLLQSGDDR